MSNILALAQKELRAYFVSPIAYVLLVFFALLFGWFYIAGLRVMTVSYTHLTLPTILLV